MCIQNTSFRGANLRYISADLNDKMTGCDLTDADITGSTLPLSADQLRSTKSFKDKNLAGVTIRGIDLSGTSFVGFDLTDARLLNCNLEGCDFTDAVITRIEITGLTFDQLKGTKNYKAKDLSEILFTQGNFDNANFRECKLGAFYSCSFRNADFTDAEFAKTITQDRLYHYHGERIGSDVPGFSAQFYRCGFIDSPVTRQQFESTKTYKHKDLSLMLFVQMNLDQWDFRDCNLDNTKLTRSLLRDTDFTNASVQETDFSYTNITREQWLSTRTFRVVEKFMPPTTCGIDMSNYDFSGMTIQAGPTNVHPNFFDTNLKNADFSNATLINVGFERCDLTDTNFVGATLNSVRFERTPLTWDQFLSTKNGKEKDFSHTSFSYTNIKGWDFSNAVLTPASFLQCDFPDSVFDNTTVNIQGFHSAFVKSPSDNAENDRRVGLTREQFMSTANYHNKDLRNAWFRGDDLHGMDFSGFDMTNARFIGCNLTDTHLDGATIKGCVFNAGLSKEQFYSTETYKSGVIEGITFYNMDFTDWDFSEVRFVNCQFYECVGAW